MHSACELQPGGPHRWQCPYSSDALGQSGPEILLAGETLIRGRD